MVEITDFYFTIASQLWQIVVSQWILSIGVLILIIGWVISLYNGSTRQ